MLTILLCFGVGILADELATSFQLFVNRRSALPASGVSFLITLVGFWIIKSVIGDPTWYNALSYALGNAVGCYLIVKLAPA